jgi:EAL domain-containing protein (putative c-di-GMP-specific phosphodiesterase class I)
MYEKIIVGRFFDGVTVLPEAPKFCPDRSTGESVAMGNHCLAFQLQNPELLLAVFGEKLMAAIQHDLTQDFAAVVQRLLERHITLGGLRTPAYGLWYQIFSLKRPAWSGSDQEQRRSLAAAAAELIREAVLKNFGLGTGSRLRVKVAILPLPDVEMPAAALDRMVGRLLADAPDDGHRGAVLTRAEFRELIADDLLLIYLQPVYALLQEKIIGFEALVRGPLDSRVHSAGDLLGAASGAGLRETLELACVAGALDWGLKLPAPLWVFINISPALIRHPDFFKLVTRRGYRAIRRRVVLEFTEHLPLEEIDRLKGVLKDLKELGFRLALDDTGCGFFDLQTVKTLRPEIVKLCITVTSRVGRQLGIAQEIRRTAEVIAGLGGRLLAEGVERKQQSDILRQCGVSLAQGFYYGRPGPAADWVNALEALETSATDG